jgi:hypothetical protein
VLIFFGTEKIRIGGETMDIKEVCNMIGCKPVYVNNLVRLHVIKKVGTEYNDIDIKTHIKNRIKTRKFFNKKEKTLKVKK